MTYADTVPGPDGRPLDQIRLTGVRAVGHHGVLPHERTEGQTFSADVVLHLDTRSAASSDDLADTVSYADVAHDVHDVLAGEPVDLVETLAERIAAVVLNHAAVQAVDVRVHKPQAPIEVPFDDVEIVVRRDRANLPAVAAPVAAAPAAVPVGDDVPAAVAAPFDAAPADAAQADEAPADDVVEVGQAMPVEPAREIIALPAAVPLGTAFEAQGTEGQVEEVAAAPEVLEEEPAAPIDPLDAPPASAVGAVLALGSNVGDPQGTLRAAVTDIDRIPGVQVMEVSPLARTVAVGPEQPDFLNAVLLVHTTLPPRDLLGACQEIELLHGRVREEHWGPRTLDIDIIVYGDLSSDAEDLQLPHPRAGERAFVLVPWAELDPEAVLGGLGGGPVARLAATAPDRSGIRWLALDWLTEPASTGAVQAQPQAVAEPAPVDAPAYVEPEPEAYAQPEPAYVEHVEPERPAYVEPEQVPHAPVEPEQPPRPHGGPGAVPPAPQAAYEHTPEPAYQPEVAYEPEPAYAPEPAYEPVQMPGDDRQDLVTSVPGPVPVPHEVPSLAPAPTPEPAPAPTPPSAPTPATGAPRPDGFAQQWTVPAPEWTPPQQEAYQPERRAFDPAPQQTYVEPQAAYPPERQEPPVYVPPPVSGPQQQAPATPQSFSWPPAPPASPEQAARPTDPGFPPYAPDHRPQGPA